MTIFLQVGLVLLNWGWAVLGANCFIWLERDAEEARLGGEGIFREFSGKSIRVMLPNVYIRCITILCLAGYPIKQACCAGCTHRPFPMQLHQ